MNLRALSFAGLGLLLLAGLFLWLRPAPGAASAAAPAVAPAAAPALRAPPAPPVYSLVVSQGRRVSGPELIRVHAGEPLVLEVTSDQADELHLHGYDLHLKLLPGQPGRLGFTASLSGRFDFELHRADLELGVLEVLPQ
jgi:hypothetical protein